MTNKKLYIINLEVDKEYVAELQKRYVSSLSSPKNKIYDNHLVEVSIMSAKVNSETTVRYIYATIPTMGYIESAVIYSLGYTDDKDRELDEKNIKKNKHILKYSITEQASADI
jgi:CRISPR/Cas system CSM-associated protein Csm2 small subunit